MPKILDGKVVRDEIMAELREKIGGFKVVPNLAIVRIGDDPDSDVYVKRKIDFAKKIGANAYVVDMELPNFDFEGEEKEILGGKFKKEITQARLLAGIEKLNKDKNIHGIIIQSPLPEPLNWAEAVEKVAPEKDVDGLCSVNVKKLLANDKNGIVPATARGVLTLLNYYKVPLKDKKVAVMGRSALVGKPIAVLMQNNGAEVSVVHSQTSEPEKITREADVLIVAIGKPELVGVEYVNANQTVIDVGISSVLNSDGSRKIYGDVDFESVKDFVSAISPVPGGVGPMTVASLFQNLVESTTNLTQ